MDSPGYQTIADGKTITVVIPTAYINGKTTFSFEVVTTRMQGNTSNVDLPLLASYELYEVLSEDVSLPFNVQ